MITLASLLGLVLFHQWPVYIWLLIIVGFGSGIVFPASYAMAGAVWKEGGRRAFNAIYVAQNAGVAVGSALGGMVAAYSFTYVFLANALLYVLFFLIVFFGFRNIKTGNASQASVLDYEPVSSRTKFTALLILSGGYVLGWIAYSQWVHNRCVTYSKHRYAAFIIQCALDRKRNINCRRTASHRSCSEKMVRRVKNADGHRLLYFYRFVRRAS